MQTKKFIFVLCPPFQGSTLLINLLDSSEKTTSFTHATWAGEGHWLLRTNGDTNYENNRWDPDYELDMNLVKNCYDKYWNHSKNIYIEKSPPSICRAKMFEDYFSKFGEVYFIISIRDPYASTWHENSDWIECAKYQKHNIETLKNTIVTSYEELCLDIDNIITKIKEKIPELSDIKNQLNKNLITERAEKINDSKIGRIIDKENKNKILKNNIDLMKYFNYKFID
jgi:hypothetical protein